MSILVIEVEREIELFVAKAPEKKSRRIRRPTDPQTEANGKLRIVLILQNVWELSTCIDLVADVKALESYLY